MKRPANSFEPARNLAACAAGYCRDLYLFCDDRFLDLTGRAATS
jgi:hypothetical protein